MSFVEVNPDQEELSVSMHENVKSKSLYNRFTNENISSLSVIRFGLIGPPVA